MKKRSNKKTEGKEFVIKTTKTSCNAGIEKYTRKETAAAGLWIGSMAAASDRLAIDKLSIAYPI